jgi:hypothetical protein
LNGVRSHRFAGWLRFGPLLLLLSLAMFATGPLAEMGYGGLAMSLTFPVTFLGAAIAIFHAGWSGWIAVGIWLGIAVLEARMQVLGIPPPYWGRLVDAAFVGFVVFLLVREIVRSRRVSLDTILGGISVYLLIAVLYTSLYSALEIVNRGAFLDGGELLKDLREEASNVGRYPALSYYSLVTMTTLGYGDITPVTSLARNLAASQAVLGQLYVAVFIAFLVGLLISQRKEEAETPARRPLSGD